MVKKILEMEFVDRAKIFVLDDEASTYALRRPLRVTDISMWVEGFPDMAAIIATRFPHKALELFTYQATIVQAERNYEGKRWVAYDHQYRREALARKDLNWSITDSRLYEAFPN